MKKLFISALLAATLATSAFAADGKVDYYVLTNFKVQFENASDVKWSAGKDYMKAAFSLNNERMEAFYNTNGELIGTTKSADLNNLPIKAKRAFAKKMEGYTVKEAIRFEGIDESAYYISAENEKGSVILKIDDKGFVTIKKI